MRPTPAPQEPKARFIARCMLDRAMRDAFPDRAERYAACQLQWETEDEALGG
jgi:hypothetical protein